LGPAAGAAVGAALLDAGATLLDEAGWDDAALDDVAGAAVGAAQATASKTRTSTTSRNKRLDIFFSS